MFHPAVAQWFTQTFGSPTACQRAAWPSIKAGRNTLVAAPTGSGKTLAAFLTAIDGLLQQAVAGTLDDTTRVLYISPLKALSNDVQRNLERPLAGIEAVARAHGWGAAGIRTAVRTGDTPQTARQSMRRRPPHILVTTPESFYVLLTSHGGREVLRTVRTVIVDEIHALAGDKRGAHLSLSLERLAALAGTAPLRIGLSATQAPIDRIARFLTGTAGCRDGAWPDCAIVDHGHDRRCDLGIEMPGTPLEAIMSAEVASEIHDRIAALVSQHRTTLVFVNTRRMAERVARALSERLGEDCITSHHGSMAREQRHDAETRLRTGALKALVATASLELGIDIGEVDLVCQIGATRSLATFLQRAGRAGHSIGGIAKARLFPETRDDLVECVALLDMARRGELDQTAVPVSPLDVLAQQIVAEVACREWPLGELFELCRRAYPYRGLARERFDQVLAMLADGFKLAAGRRSAYLHRDAINGLVRGRRGARLTALTCGGAIPDNADYDVVVEPGGQVVGTVNEDFAIESLPGNIFQLGNTAWRVLRVESSVLRVEDAAGQPPNIPFWFGEAPARTAELSSAVSRLRGEIERRVTHGSDGASRREALESWLAREIGAGPAAARQLYEYLVGGYRALGVMPTQERLVMERFFDESGGMQLVIHAPFGSRINRAWGLALRKRFCRKFNFELQAAAVENAIVISLGEVHSFPLDEVWSYLRPDSVRAVLTQALLAVPVFTVRWRWVATCALAIRRFRNGAKAPPSLQRMAAENLAAAVFPDQLACAENVAGSRDIPDHPLVAQTLHDCLTEAMDIDGLEALLAAIAAGRKRLVSRDVTEPSPFALEVLNANPYAFLDDAPLEERRTQAVRSRRWLDPETASDLGALDGAAIERVRSEVRPKPEHVDELHEALMLCGLVRPEEIDAGATEAAAGSLDERIPDRRRRWFEELKSARRATAVRVDGAEFWVASERLGEARAIWPHGDYSPRPAMAPPATDRDAAVLGLLRSRLEAAGPVTAETIASSVGLSESEILQALHRLEALGAVLRGRFTPGARALEWCERRLLARIHRYTIQRLRREIEPVPAGVYMRFLLDWQHAAPGEQLRGPRAIDGIVERLGGFEAPAAAWERDLLPLRVADYEPGMLDQSLTTGRASWLRLSPKRAVAVKGAGPLRSTPITLLPRDRLRAWLLGVEPVDIPGLKLSSAATAIWEFLGAEGASFFEDIVAGTRLLDSQGETALGELAAAGLVTADSFAGLRMLLTSAQRRRLPGRGRRRTGAWRGLGDAGRWDKIRRPAATATETDRAEFEVIARVLLERYGVVFRRVLERESALPPWRCLLWALRRLEIRGEVRGGRFVAGFSGEQFALPEAVDALRRVRRSPASGALVGISAADPLNLVGIVLPGLRIPSTLGNRIVYRDGEPIAVRLGHEVRLLRPLDRDEACRARTALIEHRAGPRLRAYLGG